MSSPIQTLWENNQIFGIDGIVYSDKIIIMNYYLIGKNLYKGFPLCDTTFHDVVKYYPEPYRKVLPDGRVEYQPDPNNILELGVQIQIYLASPLAYENENIYFGEGAMGNEGFVALVDKDNQLLWSILFNLTNPIMSASTKEDYLYLLSTDNTKVKINLKNLTEIEINRPESY